MDQLLLSGFSRLRVQPRNLLPAGMEITPYNHHCEDSFLPSVFGPQIKTTGSNRVFALIQSTHRVLCDEWDSTSAAIPQPTCYCSQSELAGGEPGVPARLDGRDARRSIVCPLCGHVLEGWRRSKKIAFIESETKAWERFLTPNT